MTLTSQFAKAFAAATQLPSATPATPATPTTPEGPKDPAWTVSTVNFAAIITNK